MWIKWKKIFICPILENLKDYKYKFEQFIIDKKENIIIDNSLITKDHINNMVSCEN